MDDHRRLVLAGELDGTPQRTERTPNGQSRTGERRAAAERRVALAPLRRKLDALEARMAKLSEAIGKVDAALADGTAFQKDPAKATDLARKRAEAADALVAAGRNGWRSAARSRRRPPERESRSGAIGDRPLSAGRGRAGCR